MHDARAEIIAFVAGWYEAWSARDIPAYLACYASLYQGRETTPEAWRTARSRVIANAGIIQITITRFQITRKGDDRAVVTFRQSYRASKKSDVGAKELQLRRIDGRWRIHNEIFVPDGD